MDPPLRVSPTVVLMELGHANWPVLFVGIHNFFCPKILKIQILCSGVSL